MLQNHLKTPRFLSELGFRFDFFGSTVEPTFNFDRLGRVTRVDRGGLLVETINGSQRGLLTGKLLQCDPEEHPVVGDWVIWVPMDSEEVVVVSLLPRRSQLSRVAAGNTSQAQVLVANVDLTLIVMALDNDFNISRLERYLAMVLAEPVQVVVLLTKSDLCPDPDSLCEEVRTVAPGAQVLSLCAPSGVGLEPIKALLVEGTTAVLLGSSGVGKSTLINALLEKDLQLTNEVRLSDHRGKHTTTARTLLRTPLGGVIIDTPGIREILPFASESVLDLTFPEIKALSEACRYRDCSHQQEPECAVLAAVERGELAQRRLTNYQKLMRDAARAIARTDERMAWASRSREKSFGKMAREAQNLKKARNSSR